MAEVKVLVVEDEVIVARDIQSRLESLGYTVAGIVTTGEEAVTSAEETIPDLVLMDIMLKGEMDGIQATEQITSRLNIPVVYLTAYADELTLQRAKVTGPFGYIVKPFEQRRLHTTIETALFKHEMERRLKESELRYRSVVETARDAIVTVDDAGAITFWNRAAERMFGYEAAEIIGKPMTDIIPRRFRSSVRKDIAELVNGDRPANPFSQQLDVVALHKDGNEFSVELSGEEWQLGDKRFYTSIIRDVTERKHMEEAILRGKQEWERTFDTVPDMIAILDTGYRVIRANRPLAARLKRDVKKLIGKHFYEVLYGTANPPEEYRLPRIWEDGEEFHREFHLAHLDGDFSITLTPLYDPSKRLIGSVFVGRDVTELRRADEALKRQAMIDQAEHIFSSIRHEMGNALNTLKTTLTVLRKNYQSFDEQKRETYFNRCLDTFKVAERLLSVLKEYQKFDNLELTPVYLDRFFQQSSGLFVDLARHARVECRVESLERDVRINVDRDALIQVLLNVVDNAIAATESTPRPLVIIKSRRLKDWAVITVTDNGSGIPPEELPKVFTPLFTTKPEGSGLGMAIVQKRMMQMGGEARIVSKPNQGTTVELWLPLYNEERVPELHSERFPN